MDRAVGGRAAEAIEEKRVNKMKSAKKKSLRAWVSTEIDPKYSLQSSDCKSAVEHKLFDMATMLRAGAVYAKSVVRHFNDQSIPALCTGNSKCELCSTL